MRRVRGDFIVTGPDIAPDPPPLKWSDLNYVF
jgi:hypothetical protein